MEIVNRQGELNELRKCVSNPPALVVLRGRRRVGKSFLLRAALPGERVVSFQADEQDQQGQLALIAREAARLVSGSPPLSFQNWDQALDFFASQAEHGPLILILDEFQYLCASKKSLPSILQRHWDSWQNEPKPISLILSGSALTFMEGLLAHGGPLYGRAQYRPLLAPLDYRDAAKFAKPGTGAGRLIARYGVLGGTPQYQVWAGQLGLRQVIRDAILTKGVALYEEPLNLLRAEEGVREPRRYFSALHAIARGRTNTGAISSLMGLSPSHTYRMLERLKELQYIELREPLTIRKRTARSYWRISDPYFRFWFRYVFPNRSRLERARVGEVLEEIVADFDSYLGHVFEDCCRAWLGAYAQLKEARESAHVGSWWSRDGRTEVDVVAARERKYKVLGSCKWSARVDEGALDRLYEDRALLGAPAAQARLVLFARGGFSDKLKQRAEEEDVLLVTCDDLFHG